MPDISRPLVEAPQPCRFDLPYGGPAPAVINPELGLARLVSRGGKRNYEMTVTVLDAPDHRLLRAGVLVAHRVSGEVGEWYLAAPAWAPHLPAERTYGMASEDLPEEAARLIRPFLRRSPLAPVAALSARHDEYHLRGPENEELAVFTDEQVTVRRGGLAVARYRELQVTPTERLTAAQLDAIREAVLLAGGAQMNEFPPLVARLGAPATGLSDFQGARPWSRSDTLEQFVGALLATHLAEIFQADLALRAEASDEEPVIRALWRLRDDLRGLYSVVEPGWLADTMADLEWVLAQADDLEPLALLGERYFSVLDRLVVAARAPRLGAVAHGEAGVVLAQELQAALATFLSRGRVLAADAGDEAWRDALESSRNVAAIAHVARSLYPKKAAQLARRMAGVTDALAECAQVSTTPVEADIETLDPVVAFAEGREFERATFQQTLARVEFLSRWREMARGLRKAEIKP